MIIRPILTAFCATVAIFASAGESWSEPPGASHPVSRNASKTQPAKLLAVFVVDSNDKELTKPSTHSAKALSYLNLSLHP